MRKSLTFLALIYSTHVILASDVPLQNQEVRFNGRPFFEARKDLMITAVYNASLIEEGNINIAQGEEIPYKNTLAGYNLVTSPSSSIFELKTTQKGSIWDYSFKESIGDPVLSNVLTHTPNGEEFLHHDIVAKRLLLDNTFIEGLLTPRINTARQIRIVSGKHASLDIGVYASRGPIEIQSQQFLVEQGGWFRTPTGIFITPKEKSNSLIKEIEVIPRLYIYSQCKEHDQSWTAFIEGKVDFINSTIDLKVQNAKVKIIFDKKIAGLEEGDGDE